MTNEERRDASRRLHAQRDATDPNTLTYRQRLIEGIRELRMLGLADAADLLQQELES